MIYNSNIFVVIDPEKENTAVLDRVDKMTGTACGRVHFF